MPGRAVWAAALGLIAAAVLAAGGIGERYYTTSLLSSSPLNRGPGGTSTFFSTIKGMYNVELGNVSSIGGEKSLFIIIGPDVPFTPEEAGRIADLVKRGSIDLLLADETNLTSKILEELGLNPFGPMVLNSSNPISPYIVGIKCGNTSALTTKAAVAPLRGDGKVLCKYANGEPAAILYEVNGSRVVIVGDSSIFANYEFDEGVLGSPATRRIALFLVEEAMSSKDERVIMEVSHYLYNESLNPATVPARILDQLLESAGKLRVKASTARPEHLIAAMLAVSLPFPLILLTPSRRPTPRDEEMIEVEGKLLEKLAFKLGLDVDLEEVGPEDILEELEGEEG
ncbi:MAG: hypothetical protein F7C35_08505 [Desulfurococcales archaeon]|nr:hypothetical protein [Desulfurococcales archaeon]